MLLTNAVNSRAEPPPVTLTSLESSATREPISWPPLGADSALWWPKFMSYLWEYLGPQFSQQSAPDAQFCLSQSRNRSPGFFQQQLESISSPDVWGGLEHSLLPWALQYWSHRRLSVNQAGMLKWGTVVSLHFHRDDASDFSQCLSGLKGKPASSFFSLM